eukprot:TRINITY_DN15984_c0_g1_i1.p1 TRINITY_DN15984_c0_g1~~TRINITY_DN15984_c0_g1_i1.p1  ORF type:complete len:373 (+),score=56.26 TRINITY_DN15984_c0_g1_i1:26-1120(+)
MEVEYINHMNVTVELGSPTKLYHVLRGKHKQFIAEKQRPMVENWYNNHSTPKQRRYFKHIMRCVRDMKATASKSKDATDSSEYLQAMAVLKHHGGVHIDPAFRKLTTIWLSRASPSDRHMFRETFGKIRPLPLFNGKSDYDLTYSQDSVNNTAEHVHKRNVNETKKKLLAVKLARIRNSTVASEAPSSSLPATEIESVSGSRALASTVSCGRQYSHSRTGPRDLVNSATNEKKKIKGTTYESFFGLKPPTKQLQQSAHKAWHSSRPGAPWGDIQEGFIAGALQSHTTLHYPPQDPSKFKNYNENYALLLSTRFDKEKDAANSDLVSRVSVASAAKIHHRPQSAAASCHSRNQTSRKTESQIVFV